MNIRRWIALAFAVQAAVASAAFPDVEAPDPCAGSGTQAALVECAHQVFLQASAGLSTQSQQIESALKPGQRTIWRRAQKAWMTYRTQACHFESQLADSNARAMVQWQCAARMTREQAAELSRLTACKEGEAACPFHGHPDRKRLSSIFRRR